MFGSDSEVGDEECFVFTTVDDEIVESDELMSFLVTPDYDLDTFVNQTDTFNLTIQDNDGMQN